ncbi:hypothetical protein FACS189450_02340 [Spirochaetia bacterium]|nr:hypothetical protein FACS189450_02340 [Spirochaetia bacterium]
MKILLFCLLVPLFFGLSCTSKPATAEEGPAVPFPVIIPEPVLPVPGPVVIPPPALVLGPVAEERLLFDPKNVPREVYDYTKQDVQNYIENLNRIIRARNYDGWVANLEEDYFNEKNSPEYLRRTSEQPRLKTQGIALTNAHDYFIHVVVPSRSRDRVDDIEFINQRRVKAYTITGNGQRLRLYDLEYENGTWKIIN